MASPKPRNIDWGTAEIEGGILTVELTGNSSKPWRQRFESVLALLETPHSRWGGVCITRKGIQVAGVEQGTETELRHFLESIVLQINSELPQPEESTQHSDEETHVGEAAQLEREMTAAFRSFADPDA
jgi:hypothetical protein